MIETRRLKNVVIFVETNLSIINIEIHKFSLEVRCDTRAWYLHFANTSNSFQTMRADIFFASISRATS